MLKNKLTIQHFLILLVTVAVTLTVTLVYSFLFTRISFRKTLGSDAGLIVVLENEEAVYTDARIDSASLPSVLMDLKVGKSSVEMGGSAFTVREHLYTQEGTSGEKKVFCLTPSSSVASQYTHILWVVLGAFLCAFLGSVAVAAKRNYKSIAEPILTLRDETNRLADGDVDTAIHHGGDAEIGELCDAVERLRLKLYESVQFQKKADDSRKFMISGISHDLRTPVTALRGYIEGVLDGVADTDEKRRLYLESALAKVSGISSMIDDLLLYSKLDLYAVSFSMKPISIFTYLSDFVAQYQSDFDAKGKRLILNALPQRDIFINVDCEKLSRVLQNILSNADKHTADFTGEVVISLRENHASVIIDVQDNGEGIRQEDLPHIFTRFYRSDAARKNDGSSGLGLTIAKQMVEGMDGRIWASSTPGEGARISVSFKKTS